MITGQTDKKWQTVIEEDLDRLVSENYLRLFQTKGRTPEGPKRIF